MEAPLNVCQASSRVEYIVCAPMRSAGEKSVSVAGRAANSGPPADLSAVAWVPREELNRRQWVDAGRKLGAIGRSSQWWIGDWIRYGSAKWGERYSEAAYVTGYDQAKLAQGFDIPDGVAMRHPASTHRVENSGETEIRAVIFEDVVFELN